MALMLLIPLQTVTAGRSPFDWAAIRLDYVKRERVSQLESFCTRIHALAQRAAEDEFVAACFDINLTYHEASQSSPPPDALTERITELNKSFDKYYISQYFSFYDILFIDRHGHAFHTIKKEHDFRGDVIHDAGADTLLAKCLRNNPTEEVFIDFHNYGPSSEPAAFFVEPMFKDGQHVGWLVLQCAINKVNTIFAWTEDLGQTGETILVNREGLMLTESNFIGDSTILKKRLDNRNIQAKFAERKGRRTVVDYRGHQALTSFEVVEFLGTGWLVVAKIDTDEVVTQHYVQHKEYYSDRLLSQLGDIERTPPQPPPQRQRTKTLCVDMDEFLKAGHSEWLETFGLSTCTGLLATYPGRFAYLGHISPKDKVYGADDTNLVGQMVKQLKSFDIYPCEKSKVKFVVLATHQDTILPIIDKLVEEGFLLSQIRFVFNPEAESGSILYDYTNDTLDVAWRYATQLTYAGADPARDGPTVGSMIYDAMYLSEEPEPPKATAAKPAENNRTQASANDA